MIIKHRLSKNTITCSVYWISQVCKNYSPVQHIYVSQGHVGRLRVGWSLPWLFVHWGWHETISDGQVRVDACPTRSSLIAPFPK